MSTLTLLTQIAQADIRPRGEEGGAGEGEPLPDYCSDTASQQQYHSLLDYRTLVGYITADIEGLLMDNRAY